MTKDAKPEMELTRTVSTKPEDRDPVRRGKPGAGSYEDPAEEARRKRRPGKT